MLPDLRFVVGAVVVTALIGMTGLGLFASTKLSQQAKMGPLEAARSQAFTDSAEWNQFYDADSVRRFVGLARRAELVEAIELVPQPRTEDGADLSTVIALTPAEMPQAQHHDAEAAPVVVARSTPEEAPANAEPPGEPAATTIAAAPEPQREAAAVMTAGVAPMGVPSNDVAVLEPEMSELSPREADVSEVRLVDSRDDAASTMAAISPAIVPQSQWDVSPPPPEPDEPMPRAGEANWDQEPWDMTAQADSYGTAPAANTPLVTAPVALPIPEAARHERAVTLPRSAPAVRRTAAEPEPRSTAATESEPRSPASPPRTRAFPRQRAVMSSTESQTHSAAPQPRAPGFGARSLPSLGASRYDSLLHTVHPYAPHPAVRSSPYDPYGRR